ncbi:MAG: hypothetical protein BAA01_13450 [Bacillus thermozeamaize]|uniref:Uncharacterized protein n=1 Tax=Bacillus thermozeamaize TaxID=230954 RepID=A0A1Y3PPT3_9BACI|nr:MAG: hypothetical protein BAA01_13450 [Bacillus thermozeamaize]
MFNFIYYIYLGLVFAGLYIWLFIKLIRILDITKTGITAKDFLSHHTGFEGIVVLIEDKILQGDAQFYKKLFSLLKRRGKLLVVKIDFDDDSMHEEIAKLLTYFEAKGLTSIYHHNKSGKKLIFDLSAHSGYGQRDIYLEVRKRLINFG